jgi:YD repeat-containing protein
MREVTSPTPTTRPPPATRAWGRLTSFTDESGSTALTYDNFENITQDVRVIGGKTYTTACGYDLANRVKEII